MIQTWLFIGLCLVGATCCQQTETPGLVGNTGVLKPPAPPDSIPDGLRKLLRAYPDFLVGATADSLFWNDGERMLYDDGREKTGLQKLESPDLEDQMSQSYPKNGGTNPPENDAGRIRSELFFKKMYGQTKQAVEANLTEIRWLPNRSDTRLRVTNINGVAEKLQAISNELDSLPELLKYLEKPGGTFVWRNIRGTARLSNHSFGNAVDINVGQSDYWQWACNCTEEAVFPAYKNRIPRQIVAIFEKYGFIWGGNWRHFDTMHFEYRPELL